MNCPGCSASMTALNLDGHLGTRVELDLCPTCQVIWFDHLESLRLSPGAVLKLFQLIGERKQMAPAPITGAMKCPRCELRLLFTQDRQRNTPFRYWRCGREHGRLITFFDFLREKDFIRPLSPQQLAELRENVQMVNCSNCGAPIDLTSGSECSHCGTPVSMLDLKQVEQMVDHLRRAAEPKTTSIDPMLPARLEREKREVERLFAAYRGDAAWSSSSSFGLVELGLRAVSKWFKTS
jgi:hypothetical protein